MTEHDALQALISAYIDDEISAEERQRVENHLLECRECQKFYQDLTRITSSLQTWSEEPLSPDLEQNVKKQIVAKREEQIMKKHEWKFDTNLVSTMVVVCLVLTVSLRVYTQRARQVHLPVSPVQPRVIPPVAETDAPKIVARGKPQSVPEEKDKAAWGLLGQKGAEPVAMSRVDAYDQRSGAYTAKSGEYAGNEGSANSRDWTGVPYEGVQSDAKAVSIPQEEYDQKTDALSYQQKSESSRLTGSSSGSEPAAAFGVPVSDAATVRRAASGFQESRYEPVWSPNREEKETWYHPPSQKGQPYDRYPPSTSTEQYDHLQENPFQSAADTPLSTFSVDVDTASYANIRRFLNNGQLPPQDAVRIEEMVNYFVYDYPQPEGNDPFSITTETAPCPWNSEHLLTMIGLKGKELTGRDMVPSNLVFLVDVSGSMNKPEKLPLLKTALHEMTDQLRREERVSIVTYAGQAGLVLDSTPGYDRRRIHQAIDRMQAGGSTAGSAGLELAYRIARDNFLEGGNNRVILATDGDFNVGISSDDALVRLIEEKRRSGIYLTVLGFGTGNYKDAKMEKLADKGDGNYYYIDSLLEAKKVLVSELGSLLYPIAQDVKLQVEFNPAQVGSYRLVGYENRALAKEDFNDDAKDAGELGAGHTVTAFYEIVPADFYEDTGMVDPLKYIRKVVVRDSRDLMTIKLRYKEPGGTRSRLLSRVVSSGSIRRTEQTTDNFRFASAVAEFGLLLRDSSYKGTASYENVARNARTALGRDRWGYRTEFLRLVDQAGRMGGYFKGDYREDDLRF